MPVQQGDLFPKGKGSGGTRLGAGRKAKRPTAVIRVPEYLKPLILNLVQHFESEQKEINVDYLIDINGSSYSLKLVTTNK